MHISIKRIAIENQTHHHFTTMYGAESGNVSTAVEKPLRLGRIVSCCNYNAINQSSLSPRYTTELTFAFAYLSSKVGINRLGLGAGADD